MPAATRETLGVLGVKLEAIRALSAYAHLNVCPSIFLLSTAPLK